MPVGTKILFYYLDGRNLFLFRLLSVFRINISFPKSQTGWRALALALYNVLLGLCIHFVCCIPTVLMHWETLTSVGCLQIPQAAHEAAPTVCVTLSPSLLLRLPHTQIWCSPSLAPAVVVLSIVWWRAKTTVARKRQWRVLPASALPAHVIFCL